MTQTKFTPEISVLLFPRETRDRRVSKGFLVADLLTASGTLTENSPGVFVREGVLKQFSPWVYVSPDLQITNCAYTAWGAGGQVSNHAIPGGDGGFHALSRWEPKDLNIAGQGAGNATFEAVSGDWKAVPAAGGYGKGLYSTGAADGPSEIQSGFSLAKNGDFRARLQLLGTKTQLSAGQIPQTNVYFGSDKAWRVTLRFGMAPAIERKVDSGESDLWRVVRVVEEAGLVGATGEWDVQIKNLAGKLNYTFNGVRGWCSDMTAGREAMAASWDAAPIRVETRDWRARFDYGPETFDPQAPATITRKVFFGTKEGGGGKPPQLAAMLEPIAGGIALDGSSQKTEVELENNGITYTTTLKPTATTTPLLQSVVLAYEPVWTSGAVSAGVEAQKYIPLLDLDLAHPPVQSGSTGSLTLDSGFMGHLGDASLDAVTQDFCPVQIKARWRGEDGLPIVGEGGQWQHLFDGTLHGASQTGGSWNGRQLKFMLRDGIAGLQAPSGVIDSGYYPLDIILARKNQAVEKEIFQVTDENGVPLQGEDGYFWRDDTDFSTDPPTRIISVYKSGSPLGVDPKTGQRELAPDDRIISQRPVSLEDYRILNLYGAECVLEILKLALGPNVAQTLNGGEVTEDEWWNGATPLGKFFPDNHPPMLGWNQAASLLGLNAALGVDTSAGKLQQGKFLFEPPYLDDALSWIEKFKTDEYAAFFWGKTDRATQTKNVPIYGRYSEFLRQCSRIWSAEEVDFDSFDFESRPDKTFNHVLIVANPPGADAGGVAPAIRMGEARLASNHPHSEENIGRRTFIVRSNYGVIPGAASALARAILRDLPQSTSVWPTAKLARGEGWILPGDGFVLGDFSNVAPGLTGAKFRAARVSHKISKDGGTALDWKTDLSLCPLSVSELSALNASQNTGFALKK